MAASGVPSFSEASDEMSTLLWSVRASVSGSIANTFADLTVCEKWDDAFHRWWQHPDEPTDSEGRPISKEWATLFRILDDLTLSQKEQPRRTRKSSRRK
jgi:hypothetical protein